MNRIKLVVLILLIFLILIQFVQPAPNRNSEMLPTDITRVYSVPVKVQAILKKACYDCHSNDTRYPWYSRVQPVGWWLSLHIRKGKSELNFSEFGDYSKRRQISRLKAIANSIVDGTMPLPAYTFIHRDAQLTIAENRLIREWADETKDRISRE